MGIISYAQNYEDVILWRALGGLEDGFYLDVGANDPEELSVTKWFYDQGWHGINLEPSEEYYQLLCKARLDITAVVYRPCRRNETASPQKWYRRFSEK